MHVHIVGFEITLFLFPAHRWSVWVWGDRGRGRGPWRLRQCHCQTRSAKTSNRHRAIDVFFIFFACLFTKWLVALYKKKMPFVYYKACLVRLSHLVFCLWLFHKHCFCASVTYSRSTAHQACYVLVFHPVRAAGQQTPRCRSFPEVRRDLLANELYGDRWQPWVFGSAHITKTQ